MKNPDDPNAIKNDVLHAQEHSHLTSEEIAKAVARHKREHGGKPTTDAKAKSGAKRK